MARMAVEHIADLCVKLGLIFVEQQATTSGARRFFVSHGNTCLVAADDPMQVEHYLYGWRDAMSVPNPKAHEAADYLNAALGDAEKIYRAASAFSTHLKKVEEFIDPMTREGS